MSKETYGPHGGTVVAFNSLCMSRGEREREMMLPVPFLQASSSAGNEGTLPSRGGGQLALEPVLILDCGGQNKDTTLHKVADSLFLLLS